MGREEHTQITQAQVLGGQRRAVAGRGRWEERVTSGSAVGVASSPKLFIPEHLLAASLRSRTGHRMQNPILPWPWGCLR